MFGRIRILLATSFLLALVGFCLCGYGWTEQKVGAKATADPVDADLAQLEADAGKPLDNYHLKIGPHYACYYSTVYSYKVKKGAPRNTEAATKLDYAFYPIVSKSNPDLKELDKLKEKYGDLSKAPEDEMPLPTRFVVLVKTKRFKTVGDLPDAAITDENSLQGLVTNEIDHLTADEKKLIKEEFPTIDFSKVLIVEADRKPYSTTTTFVFMMVGFGLVVAAFVVFCWMVVAAIMGMAGAGKRS
jgi:hypothetical protein